MVTAQSPPAPAFANRFDALRLFFAALVFAAHIVILPELDRGGEFEAFMARLAEYAVRGFFIISGALVYGSLLRSKTNAVYFSKRARRLVPAYAVIVFIPTMIGAILLAANCGLAQLAGVAKYFAANIVFANFIEPRLPGLFENNRFNVVNGSLWTIKIEVMFYLALPVLGFILARLKKRGALIFLAGLYVAGEVWRISFEYLADAQTRYLWTLVAHQLPGFMAYFASGMALWISRDFVKQHLTQFGLGSLALFAVTIVFEAALLLPLALTGLIAFAAWARGPALNATRWGDLSYGLYIVHFPILQTLIAGGLFERSLLLAIIVSVMLVTASALLMWQFVERPWLRRDSHYRRTETAA